MRTHDELEDPGEEMSTVEAHELRKRLRTPPASMLETGVIGGARQAMFAAGHLDRPSGPARRTYSLTYLALVRFDQALTGNRQCLDAAIISWRTCLEVWEAAGEAERSAFAEIHSVDCSLAGVLGTRYNLNREFLVHPDPPVRPDEVRADLEEAFRAIERGAARLPSHRDGSDPQLQVCRQQLQAVKAYLVSLKYADMPAGPGSGSEMRAVVTELDLVPYAPPGDATGARSTWLGTRMFLAQALSGPGARISDLRRAEEVLLGFLEAPDLTEESLIAAAQLSLATTRMLLADSTGDERYRPLAQDAFEQSYLTGARSNLRTAWDAATQQAGWAHRDGHRLVAARAYAAAFRVLPVLTHTQITRADKESALAMAADVLPMCARELANSSATEDRIEAVLALEGARGVLLAEGLGLRAGPATDRATSRLSSTVEGDARTAQAIEYLTRELDGLRRQELAHPAGTEWKGAARMAACQRQLALVHARSRDESDEAASRPRGGAAEVAFAADHPLARVGALVGPVHGGGGLDGPGVQHAGGRFAVASFGRADQVSQQPGELGEDTVLLPAGKGVIGRGPGREVAHSCPLDLRAVETAMSAASSGRVGRRLRGRLRCRGCRPGRPGRPGAASDRRDHRRRRPGAGSLAASGALRPAPAGHRRGRARLRRRTAGMSSAAPIPGSCSMSRSGAAGRATAPPARLACRRSSSAIQIRVPHAWPTR
ncbi:hypothetical protein [Streptomyces sp. NPDC058268]|uniref:hypothetical protein n=1 Tax=Streptomyces sp. NPDC058268 TaxID=3346413 RepID=UPI0036E38F89